ncbi:SHOCT domain-containing protein [Candidatus Spongiihabitans sp.]|uniref:SHOCT domain-containing protein n=1 Tax=Candidatus Spongiihabitans sp. TaxID=3101308 RepID=UPI003C6ED3F8
MDGDLTRSQNRNWQKTRYFHDKKKNSYIEEKKQWAERWRLKVADGIKGKLPVQPVQSVSDRLAKLQQLLDDGVISKQDFEKKKAGILEAL